MANFFKNGTLFWLLSRSNIYDGDRSIDSTTFFAGLYGNTNIEQEPMSAGRQMGGILPPQFE
jgi:hypothetical protein